MSRKPRPRTDIEEYRRAHQISVYVEETFSLVGGLKVGKQQFAWRCSCGEHSDELRGLEVVRLEAKKHADPYDNLYGEFADAFDPTA